MSRNLLTSALFGLAAIVALSGCSETRKLDFEFKGTSYECKYTEGNFKTRMVIKSDSKIIKYENDRSDEISTETLTIPEYDSSFVEARELVDECYRANDRSLPPEESLDGGKDE